mmetsp:Transcript_45694/g.120430  ORF Transcript_45694/g.120430 Transcript_45694/m.120430 type:complete len:1169 (-) Transcript_45694:945-4451(-)
MGDHTLSSRNSQASLVGEAAVLRYVHFNNGREGEIKYPSNSVNQAMYTIWNFWYLLAYEELIQKFPNAYFLVVSCFQMHPATTNTNSFPTTLPVVMLVFFLMSTMKLFEDAQRRKADHIANNMPTIILDKSSGELKPAAWVDITVGDVVQVKNRESVPADMLIIATYEPEPNNPHGACSVETKSLDGETNLKEKGTPSVLRSQLGGTLSEQTANWMRIHGYAECEQPNATTQKFTGALHVDGTDPMAININNMLLRGCTLRNTEYVLGLVINTGVDTKVMQGARKPVARMSTIEKSMNPLLVLVVILLAVLCFVGAVARTTISETLKSQAWYLVSADSTTSMVTFFQYFVLLNAFVSVSLLPSMYIAKGIQAWFMQQSLNMYHEETDTPMKVRCMFLTDELGRISHVFSDKTGTLTQNIMQFRKCSVDGKPYGRGHTEIGLARLARLGQAVSVDSLRADDAPTGPPGGGISAVNFEGPELHNALKGADTHAERCRQFFLLLALCHTVVLEEVDGKPKLSAASPDEAALVAAAAFFGFEFTKRDNDQIFVTDTKSNSVMSFTVLSVLDFSSARKRMSTILREDATGKIQLLSKGADNVMLKLLRVGQEQLVTLTEAHMKDHSNDGLRTLVLGCKDVDDASFERWHSEYIAACGSATELEKKDREEPNEIDRLMGMMENDLTLLGSTAIEDKLQSGVPTAIADMSRAGIAVWVLTGDKEETAINIAFACQLLDTTTKMTIINKKIFPSRAKITEALREATKAAEASGAGNGQEKHALVIDGEAIEMVMSDKECKLAMLQFTQNCYSVVGCRCAPSQKAQLVELVRFNVQGAITLAIGDGANDVAMIQAAHCGVGISGQEGLQAANSADFSIAQFRYLVEMLLVHGRNNYRRMSTMVMYIFYKNMVLTNATFFFAIYSAWSGPKFYLEMVSTFFNVIWTLVPIVVTTIFDKDVDDDTARMLPQIYHLGVRGVYFNPWVMARWFFDTVFEGLMILVLLYYSLESVDPPEGSDPSVFYLGGHAFTMVLLIVGTKLLLWQWQCTWYQLFCLFFFTLIWFPIAYLSSDPMWITAKFGFTLYPYFQGWTGLWQNVMDNPSFWLLCLLVPSALLLPQLFYIVWKRTFYPEFRDLAMEAETWGLDKQALAKTPIPLSHRRLPLVKDAPRTREPRRYLF